MTKHISDSERLTMAKLKRTEEELQKARETIERMKAQLRISNDRITELRDSNKLLASQVRYLVLYKKDHV